MKKISMPQKKEREYQQHMTFASRFGRAKYHRKYTLPILHEICRPPCMARDVTLSSKSDEELAAELRVIRSRREGDLTKKQKELSRIFGTWRAAVLRHEGISCARLVLLLQVHQCFIEDGDEESAFIVSRHVANEWGVFPDVSLSNIEMENVAAKACRRRDILPDQLLMDESSSVIVKPRDRDQIPEQSDFSWDQK